MGNYSLDMTPLIQQTLGWAGLGLVLALLLLPRGLRRRDIGSLDCCLRRR